MTISTRDQIANALGNNCSRYVIDKASVANAVAGQLFSLWRSTGTPAQAIIPTTASIPTSAFTGAVTFTNQTSPATSYLAWLSLTAGNSAVGVEIHDRVAQYGGLALNVTAAQPISGLDLSSGSLNLGADRRGASNYSDLQWYLEVYADGGATASNATIAVTYNDGSTGNLTAVAVGGTLRTSRLIALTPLIPSAQQGLYIRGITGVTLSASTGTAGNFGFTCSRLLAVVACPTANLPGVFDWSQLSFANVPNDACLALVTTCGTTSTGTFRGQGKIAHG